MVIKNKKWVGRFYHPRALKAAHRRVFESGLGYKGFARVHGVSWHAVRELLRERTAGTQGDSHRAAVALGLKRAPADGDAKRAA